VGLRLQPIPSFSYKCLYRCIHVDIRCVWGGTKRRSTSQQRNTPPFKTRTISILFIPPDTHRYMYMYIYTSIYTFLWRDLELNTETCHFLKIRPTPQPTACSTIHTDIYTYIHTHIYTYISMYISTFIYRYMYAYIKLYTYTFSTIHRYMYTHKHTCQYTYLNVCIHVYIKA